VSHCFRDRRRKRITDLSVSGGFSSMENPVIFKALQSSNHLESQTWRVVLGKIPSGHLIRNSPAINA